MHAWQMKNCNSFEITYSSIWKWDRVIDLKSIVFIVPNYGYVMIWISQFDDLFCKHDKISGNITNVYLQLFRQRRVLRAYHFVLCVPVKRKTKLSIKHSDFIDWYQNPSTVRIYSKIWRLNDHFYLRIIAFMYGGIPLLLLI